MAIAATDIKLLESERMSDTTDGGGRRTSRVIQDGVAGNIFPKISRLDSVYGRVNIRKIYGAVQTANVDTYAGAHAILTDAPDNEQIHVTLFSTDSEFDTRSAARDRIESYVTSGPESRMTLLGRQLKGQQSIVAYQRSEERLPEVGEVYCLSSETGAVVTEQQYFRVQTVESELRTFTETIGSNVVEFKRTVLTLGTGAALRYDFYGPENASQLSTVARPTKLRSTTFVDAARYYGIRPLAEDAVQNALSIKVDTIYTPIVPTTNRETPLANIALSNAGGLTAIRASGRSETLVSSGGWSVGASRRTLRGIKPGTLSLTAAGVADATDDGLGNIDSAAFAATVDYETGLITRTGGSSGANAWTAIYTPAVAASQIAHSKEVFISLATRGLVYVLTVAPLPLPGTLTVDYRALGKWYRLRDDGTGRLVGDDESYGTGEIDHTTGVVNMTLGALPDINSSLVISFGSPVHYVIRAGSSSDAAGTVSQNITLIERPVSPGSVEIAFTAGGIEYAGTDDSSGEITGTGGLTGEIDYTTGEMVLHYASALPDALSSVLIGYDKLAATVEGVSAVKSITVTSGGTMALGEGVVAGTLTGSVRFGGKPVFVKDSGTGLLIASGGQFLGAVAGIEGATIAGDQAIGTVNYSTGALLINTPITLTGNKFEPQLAVVGQISHAVIGGSYTPIFGPDPLGAGEWEAASVTVSVSSSGAANFGWQSSGVSTVLEAVTSSVSFSDAPLRFPLRNSIGDNIVPGSLVFSVGGETYIDRNGTLYAGVSPSTGVGTTSGSVDYSAGTVALSHWADGATPTIAVDCCLSVYGEYSTAELYLRTAGAPIRPASFYLQATALDGTVLSGESNTSGVISGTGVDGYVDQETGIVRVRFGGLVTAAGNEGEYWFDADNVEAGQIWKPTFVVPSSVRYNAVVLTSLPLNADLLGLDPVRLPSDGRVPVFRPSDVVVIHNTDSFALPNPAVAGATYDVGREDLADIWLVDQAGVKVDAAQYEYSLVEGTVTMADPLTLTGLAQPLIAKHRVEDMVLISDAQISGELTFAPALSRAYTAGETMVSSALLFGDRNARVSNLFDLLAFASWSDTPGTGASAEYNSIDYPVEVLNNGAMTERWRISFKTTTTFDVIGENLGLIASGSTGVDCAPTNALTGLPYFVIRAAGWGGGWAAGNQLRFNTSALAVPITVLRTVLPGASLTGDSFSLHFRGDTDGE